MANATQHITREFVQRDGVIPTFLWPTQANQGTLYHGVGITRDTSGDAGRFAAGERLLGFGHPDIPHKKTSRTSCSAEDTGCDIPVINQCWLKVAVPGDAQACEGKAVFLSDDQTFTLVPQIGTYVGQIVMYDHRAAECLIAVNAGANEWRTWVTLADDGTFVLPARGAVVSVSGGDNGGSVHLLADGSVTKIGGTTNFVAADTDAKLCVFDDSGAPTVRNRLGAEKTVTIKYLGEIV